jgi:hypothetical protein
MLEKHFLQINFTALKKWNILKQEQMTINIHRENDSMSVWTGLIALRAQFCGDLKNNKYSGCKSQNILD